MFYLQIQFFTYLHVTPLCSDHRTCVDFWRKKVLTFCSICFLFIWKYTLSPSSATSSTFCRKYWNKVCHSVKKISPPNCSLFFCMCFYLHFCLSHFHVTLFSFPFSGFCQILGSMCFCYFHVHGFHSWCTYFLSFFSLHQKNKSWKFTLFFLRPVLLNTHMHVIMSVLVLLPQTQCL